MHSMGSKCLTLIRLHTTPMEKYFLFIQSMVHKLCTDIWLCLVGMKTLDVKNHCKKGANFRLSPTLIDKPMKLPGVLT